jgi:hypothetical protein
MRSRQVSWLAGRCVRRAFPETGRFQWRVIDFGSPLTVAGAAPASPDGSPASLLALDLAMQGTVTTRFSSLFAGSVNCWREKIVGAC